MFYDFVTEPLELVASILSRKFAMFRSFPGRISHPLYGLDPIVLTLDKTIGYPIVKIVQYLISPVSQRMQ